MEKCVARTWTFQIQGGEQGVLRPSKWISMTRMENAQPCSPFAAEGHLTKQEELPSFKALDGKPCFWNFESCSSRDYVQVELKLLLDIAGGPLDPRSQAFHDFVEGEPETINRFEDGVMKCMQVRDR